MKPILIIAAMIIPFGTSIAAFDGFSAGLGIEYVPLARLEYTNNSLPVIDVVDNISVEPGLYAGFPNGFRVGSVFTYYRKQLDRGNNALSNLSSWGVGFTGDYGLEITESGKTFLVGGMEAGYSELTDKNEFNKKTSGGIWIAGSAGIRYFIARTVSLDFSYRIKWLEYDFSGVPEKTYDYSGSTLRATVCYGFRAFNR